MAVTLERAKQNMEYHAGDRDTLIQGFIDAAIARIEVYTGKTISDIDNAEVDDAILLIVADRFNDREGHEKHVMGLPPRVEGMLHKYRVVAA